MKQFLINRITDFFNEADAKSSKKAVDNLLQKHPDESRAELAERIIKRKCYQAGAVGAVTSSASIVPGLGTVASLTFGIAADMKMTYKLQTELVFELGYVYGNPFTDDEANRLIWAMTGLGSGSNMALAKAGEAVAKQATLKLTEKSLLSAIPVIGVAASAGANITTTYLIGQRANAYFSLPPEQRNTWDETARALTGVDERKLVGWLTDTTENSWEMLKGSTQSAAETVIIAGKSTGKAMIVQSKKPIQAIARIKPFKKDEKEELGDQVETGEGVSEESKNSWEKLKGGTQSAAGTVIGAGKAAGHAVIEQSKKPIDAIEHINPFKKDEEKPSEVVSEEGESSWEKLKGSTQSAADSVIGAGKATGHAIAQIIKKDEESEEIIGVIEAGEVISQQDEGVFRRLRNLFDKEEQKTAELIWLDEADETAEEANSSGSMSRFLPKRFRKSDDDAT